MYVPRILLSNVTHVMAGKNQLPRSFYNLVSQLSINIDVKIGFISQAFSFVSR